MQGQVEEAKQSLYRAQQELLTKAQAAEARERERSAEVAAARYAEEAARRAREAAERARKAQEAAVMEAKRQEMVQRVRQACSHPSSPSQVVSMHVCKTP